MGCSCKSGASAKQVTSVKQVVKKRPASTTATTNEARKAITKRVIYRRHLR